MPKTSPYLLKRPVREVHRFTLVEPDDPSKSFEFVVRQRHPAEDYQATEIAMALEARYIDGEDKDGPLPMPDVDGVSIAPTRELFGLVAGIYMMQPSDLSPNEKYTPEDLAAIPIVAPGVWTQLIAKCGEVQSGPKASKSTPQDASTGSAYASETNSQN